MYDVKAVSAFIFWVHNEDDPNIELSTDEVNANYNVTEHFLRACEELIGLLRTSTYTTEEEVSASFYDVGKKFYGEDKKNLLHFFSLIYTVLFQEKKGPRLGTFADVFGPENFADLLDSKLKNPFTFPFM